MQVVINIPDEAYAVLKSKPVLDNIAESIIANGTPLPKGHGRLIDADAYRKDMMDSREFNFFKILDMQSTIVEADRESDNG